MIKHTVKGTLIASAVAALFAANPGFAQDKAKTKPKAGGKTVHCAGINDCKGTGGCAGADHSCKGKNDCKGKGWVEAKSAKECTDKGGTVVAAKDK